MADPTFDASRLAALVNPVTAAKSPVQAGKPLPGEAAEQAATARGKDKLAASTGDAAAKALATPKPGKGLKSYVLATDECYEVKPGDTLRGIAERELGDAGRWKEIFDLNRDKLPNPNLLTIPHAPLAASLPAEHLLLDLPPR
ncbi:MAG: 5-nucleotidase [Cyanobacteria bacterium RYN_339]|nr:5-nucleotidase [Cyanobacteria bacterium RYN_339]